MERARPLGGFASIAGREGVEMTPAALSKCARILRAHDDEDMLELAAGIERYLVGDHDSLDRALGLRCRGGLSPQHATRLERRNAMLVALWRSTWPDHPPLAAAGLITMSARRYETGRWVREQDDATPPSCEPMRTFWKCLDLGVKIPAAQQLSRILADADESISVGRLKY